MAIHHTDNRDANEPPIIHTFEAIGYHVQRMNRHNGFDLLVTRAGIVRRVEVKNPAKRWKLTKAEKALELELKANWCDYDIIETPLQVLYFCGHVGVEGLDISQLLQLQGLNQWPDIPGAVELYRLVYDRLAAMDTGGNGGGVAS